VTRLLHVSSSPRGAASESLAIARTFLDSYRETHPDAEADTFDLWDGSLPEFGPAAAGAKMTVFADEVPTGAQAIAWQAAQDTFHRFAVADHYLFSVPMWNASVPYVLKQFIDVVSQPGMVFAFDPDQGYTGLLTGKKAAVIYTGAVWGAERGSAFGRDFQQPFFDDWLCWAGVTDITTIRFQPNLATPRRRRRAPGCPRPGARRRQDLLSPAPPSGQRYRPTQPPGHLPSRRRARRRTPPTPRRSSVTSTISRDELKAGLDAGTTTAVDALPESYYAQQHLPGALNMVADDVEARAGELLPDKSAAIVTYCSNPACQNSAQVAAKLEQLGYTNVRKYADGIQDWVEAGLPTETGIPAAR